MQLDLTIVDAAELPERAARKIRDLVVESAKLRGRACIALSGGTTPRAVHEAWAKLPDVPWNLVHVYFGDERAVPPDHSDSNYRMAKESLLSRVPIPGAQVHRPAAEQPDRDAAARAYESILPAIFDVVLLGIGEDGHTASLFPGSAALAETKRRCVAVIGPKPPPERLTLTPPVLENARSLVMLATGASKAEPVERALFGAWDPLATPSQLARRGTWFLDPAAAQFVAAHTPEK
ncbi:MAG TPA: 6-phosphogluconolactonase [Polyangiaceae bacterium]|jgi:6-phosphogluconolactonase|nr:6-phosphogluconolactonase [Polyangiaceae bacterium]